MQKPLLVKMSKSTCWKETKLKRHPHTKIVYMKITGGPSPRISKSSIFKKNTRNIVGRMAVYQKHNCSLSSFSRLGGHTKRENQN